MNQDLGQTEVLATTTLIASAHPPSSQPAIIVPRILLNYQYLKTFPGYLKLFELILLLLAFGLAFAGWITYWCPEDTADCYPVSNPTNSAIWAKAVTVITLLTTFGILLLHLYRQTEWVRKISRVKWLLGEGIYCILVALLLLTAGAVMTRWATVDKTRGAVVFFCWAALVVYTVDAGVQLMGYRSFKRGNVSQHGTTGVRPLPPLPSTSSTVSSSPAYVNVNTLV